MYTSGAPARVVRVWRCEGRIPLPHHFVCVEKLTLPYLTCAWCRPSAMVPDHRRPLYPTATSAALAKRRYCRAPKRGRCSAECLGGQPDMISSRGISMFDGGVHRLPELPHEGASRQNLRVVRLRGLVEASGDAAAFDRDLLTLLEPRVKAVVESGTTAALPPRGERSVTELLGAPAWRGCHGRGAGAAAIPSPSRRDLSFATRASLLLAPITKGPEGRARVDSKTRSGRFTLTPWRCCEPPSGRLCPACQSISAAPTGVQFPAQTSRTIASTAARL